MKCDRPERARIKVIHCQTLLKEISTFKEGLNPYKLRGLQNPRQASESAPSVGSPRRLRTAGGLLIKQ